MDLDCKLKFSVIVLALNEEKNIIPVINDTLAAFEKFNINGEIIVVDDGSRDGTPRHIKQKAGENAVIKIITHDIPRGMGASFWDGLEHATGDVVCMMPGDNENDPHEILRYAKLLTDVDIVVPFVFHKSTRSISRNIMSSVYMFIVNLTFATSFKYTNGTSLYRRELLLQLTRRCSGFFFQTDILVRLTREGYLFAEVPYRIRNRKTGKSKAISFRALAMVIRDYFRLATDIYLKNVGGKTIFLPKTATHERYNVD